MKRDAEISIIDVNEKAAFDLVHTSAKMEALMLGIGKAVIENAKRIYVSAEGGYGTRPYLYLDMFYMKMRGAYLEVGNSDPTAKMVEYGVMTNSGKFILGYGPLRNAMDQVKRARRS